MHFKVYFGLLVMLALATSPSEAQFGGLFRAIQRVLNPITDTVRGFFGFRNTATSLRNAGRDELFPSDCGRDEQNKGKLCFGDPALCRARTSLSGLRSFNGRNYYFSWLDSDFRIANTKWDWFNARNYCRKRCMDLVAFESQGEYEWVKSHIRGNNPQFFWTSGRKCNFDGCDKPEFFPKLINGWFWSANQVKMPPANSRNQFHDWSHTGGAGRAQPDNREQVQQGGEEEACLAVLNNFYGDGVRWHDVACHHEKPIVCEDEPGHLRFVLGK